MIHVSPCFCRVVKKVSPNNVTSDRFLTYSLHSNVLGIINQCPPKDSNSTMAYIQCRSCTYRHVRFRQMTYFVDLSIAKDLFSKEIAHASFAIFAVQSSHKNTNPHAQQHPKRKCTSLVYRVELYKRNAP